MAPKKRPVTSEARWTAVMLMAAYASLCGARPTPQPVVRIPRAVMLSMSWTWWVSNQGWDHGEEREIMGCLQGTILNDTIWIERWTMPQDLRQLRRAVGGQCHGPHKIGEWHTHPYDADTAMFEFKSRVLSPADLHSFQQDTTISITMAMWDFDSVDVAYKRPDGVVVHPIPLEVQ